MTFFFVEKLGDEFGDSGFGVFPLFSEPFLSEIFCSLEGAHGCGEGLCNECVLEILHL